MSFYVTQWAGYQSLYGAFGSAMIRIPSPEQMLTGIGEFDCASDGPDIPSAATAIQAGRVMKVVSDRIAEFR